MHSAQTLSKRFALTAAILFVGTLLLVFTSLNAPALLLFKSHQADVQTQELMDAICQEDWDAASIHLLGQPNLTPGKDPESPLAKLLWDAFQGSLSYEFTGYCQASDSGLCRTALVTGLDITGLMGQLKTQAPALLEEAATTLHPDLVYEEDGTYQESFVMDVLAAAAEDILQKDPPITTWEVTLNLALQNGQWYVLPDQALLNLLSGSMGR